jgi:hypothetical protein
MIPPRPRKIPPNNMSFLIPILLYNLLINSAKTPYTQKKTVNDPAVTALLHPNSFWIGTKNTPIEYLKPNINISVKNVARKTNHP